MLEGMYTAAAGMAAQQNRMDAVANDLANTSTTGYKPVRVAFRDLVYTQGGRGAAENVDLGTGAAATSIGRSTQQGSLQSTGEPLDVAVSGDGFIAVRDKQGRQALTRDGNLRLNERSQLVTSAGLQLDPPVTVPKGTAPEAVHIARDGSISVGRRKVAEIQLKTVPAPSQLAGGANNTFVPTTASGATRSARGSAELVQGSLEASGVDVGTAMTDMIEAQRSYELASKAIQMQDQMLDIANQVKR